MNSKKERSRLYEFRIRYNAGSEHSAFDNYHYYMAETASQAFEFHRKAMRKKHLCAQNISVEKYDLYAERWEDQTSSVKIKDSKSCSGSCDERKR
jgi:hypothetical protein